MPAYKDKVTFVNAITGDATGDQLASQFSFQYIPTSFFLTADGKVVDSHTGPLTAAEMRARIDRLVAQ
jgi:thioredoxin-like negative regulator of GroEL